jgi:hypothetical protein
MKFLDLHGRSHVFNYKKICRESLTPSKLHLSARELLMKHFPNSPIYEEVTLLGTGLIADFFIPNLKIIVEVHGEQHYKFVKRFHKNEDGFKKSQKRDKMKKEWCNINDFLFIELPFNKVKEWGKIIKELI